MIVLDTNVLSEVMRAHPDPRVLSWMDAQPAGELWITSITAAEVFHGIARLPAGKRKAALSEVATAMLIEDFEGRCLAFDLEAASEYAALVAERERRGRPISMADAQIAALCRAHDAALATRNTGDFAGLDLALINPWKWET